MESNPKRLPPSWLKNCSKTLELMPGVGTKAPKRYTANISSVNEIRFLKSGISVILLSDSIMPE